MSTEVRGSFLLLSFPFFFKITCKSNFNLEMCPALNLSVQGLLFPFPSFSFLYKPAISVMCSCDSLSAHPWPLCCCGSLLFLSHCPPLSFPLMAMLTLPFYLPALDSFRCLCLDSPAHLHKTLPLNHALAWSCPHFHSRISSTGVENSHETASTDFR